MKKDIFKLGLALALFAAGACVALALVYTVTGPVIAGHEQRQLQESLQDLFPHADAFVAIENGLSSVDAAVRVGDAWQAIQNGAIQGVAVKAVGMSYGGDASLIVGIGSDRRLAGVRILILKDTPGLGANATSPTYFVDKSSKTTFSGQFNGKAVSDAFEVKQDVAAITASTITSKALALIVKRAADAGASWLDSVVGGQ